jgi:hypothetical protein
LAPGGDYDLIGLADETIVAKAVRDRLAKRFDSLRRRIASVPVVDCLLPRVNDVLGGREVGLPQTQVDDVVALGLDCRGQFVD